MTNPYYNHVSGNPVALSRGVSASVRSEFDLVGVGFDAIYQLIFSNALPGINAGSAGMLVTNNGTLAGWQAVLNTQYTSVSTTSLNAAIGAAYLLTNVAATTVTLPATPNVNEKVAIKVANSLVTNVVNPNGNTIEGVSGNMTIDNANAVFALQFLNGSWRISNV